MREIVVALPAELEDRIVAELQRHGYQVVIRAVGAEDLRVRHELHCGRQGAAHEHLARRLRRRLARPAGLEVGAELGRLLRHLDRLRHGRGAVGEAE